MVQSFTLFDTAIGRCGIAWGERGIVGVRLPESRESDTRARLLRHHPDAIEASPPPDIQRALDSIVALLAGEAADLSVAVLDMHRVPPFHRRVYEAARGIGRWTVEMLLISRLGRPDVLPVDDYGIRAGFAAAFRKRKFPAPKDLVKPGAKWKPYRTVASWYLWRAADLAKQGKS